MLQDPISLLKDIKQLTDKGKTYTKPSITNTQTPTKTRSKQYDMDSYWKERDRETWKGHFDL